MLLHREIFVKVKLMCLGNVCPFVCVNITFFMITCKWIERELIKYYTLLIKEKDWDKSTKHLKNYKNVKLKKLEFSTIFIAIFKTITDS